MHYVIGIWILLITAIGLGDVMFSEGYRYRFFDREKQYWDRWGHVRLGPGVWSESFDVPSSKCVLWKTDDNRTDRVSLQEHRAGEWITGSSLTAGERKYRFIASRPVTISYRLSNRDPDPGQDASCTLVESGVLPNGFLPRGAPHNLMAITGVREGSISFEKGHTIGFFVPDGTPYCISVSGKMEQEPYWLDMIVYRATQSFYGGKMAYRRGLC